MSRAFDQSNTIKQSLLREIAELISYTSWKDEFRLKQLNSITDRIKLAVGRVDVNDLTLQECKDLGFRLWDKTDTTALYLIPLWLHPFLADDLFLGCIDGTAQTYDQNQIDNDNRFGMLAYGVVHERVYDVTIVSWENDGDHYKTLRVEGISREEAEFISAIARLFADRSTGGKGLGNDNHCLDAIAEDVLEVLDQQSDTIKQKYTPIFGTSDDLETAGDWIYDWLRETILGWPVEYDHGFCRVVDDVIITER